jgi:hypothetical protein
MVVAIGWGVAHRMHMGHLPEEASDPLQEGRSGKTGGNSGEFAHLKLALRRKGSNSCDCLEFLHALLTMRLSLLGIGLKVEILLHRMVEACETVQLICCGRFISDIL